MLNQCNFPRRDFLNDTPRHLATTANGWLLLLLILLVSFTVVFVISKRLVAADLSEESKPATVKAKTGSHALPVVKSSDKTTKPKTDVATVPPPRLNPGFVPNIENIERDKTSKVPTSHWPVALEAIRKSMKTKFPKMKLKQDYRGEHGLQHMIYRQGSGAILLTLTCCDTPREAGRSLRLTDQQIGVRNSTDIRIKIAGSDEAYVHGTKARTGSMLMCYSNIYILINASSRALQTSGARAIVSALDTSVRQRAQNGLQAQEQLRQVVAQATQIQGTWKVLFEEVGGVRKAVTDDWVIRFDGNKLQLGAPRISKNTRLTGTRTFTLDENAKPKTLVMIYCEPNWMRTGTNAPGLRRRPFGDPRQQRKYEKGQQHKSSFDSDAWLSGWLAPRGEFAYSLDGSILKLCYRSERVLRKGQIFKASNSLATKTDDKRRLWVLKRTTEYDSSSASDGHNLMLQVKNELLVNEAENTPKRVRFSICDLEKFAVPVLEDIKRGKTAKVPVSRWPAAVDAVRKGLAKEFGNMILKEDRRDESGASASHLLRYRGENSAFDINLLCYDTPREAGESLRVSDRNVAAKNISTRPGDEFRLKGVGDEAYRYFPNGSVIMCYSNVFVIIKGQPVGIKTKAAKVIANCLEDVAISETPKILNPQIDNAQKASHAARLVADYALTIEGIKRIDEVGVVTKPAGNKWLVQYDRLGRRVILHALSKNDADFKRLDADVNGEIDHRDIDRTKLVKTIRTNHYDKTDELKEAANLLRRIDKRIETLKGKHAGLSHWNKQIKTFPNRNNKNHLVPYEWSSGKLLQFNTDSITRRHRLLYRNREEKCSFSINVNRLTGGKEFHVVEPQHLKYARARLQVDSITADDHLRKKLVWIIQEELFKEPGPAGIEQRARFAARPLAHFARTGKFPDMRWQPSHLTSDVYPFSVVVRDEKQLMILCPKLDFRVYSVLPMAVRVERIVIGED